MQLWRSDRIQLPHARTSQDMLGRGIEILDGSVGGGLRSHEDMAGYRPD